MSSPALWALAQSGLTRTEKHVLTVLAVRADIETFQCYPGVEKICHDTGLERKTVMAATKSLEIKGLVTIQRRRRMSNIYTVRVRYQEVPPRGTSKENQEVPVSSLEVPFEDVRSPAGGDPNYKENNKISNFKQSRGGAGFFASQHKNSASQGGSTRNRSLEEDLNDFSWAN